jgi:hypothetical protein
VPHPVRCPSGLAGTVRGLKVREERILADRKLVKSNSIVDELLRACWEETTDAGPYAFADGKVDWNHVLQDDRFHALLEIRALTYGPEYAFAVTCREEACRARIEWELDLRLASAKIQGLERSFMSLDRRVGMGSERIGGGFRELGIGLGIMTAGAAMVGGAFALADKAAQFEQAIAAVGVVSGATKDELWQLQEAAIDAGIATQFSPTEATVGLKELAQAGFNAQDSIKLLIPVLDLAGGSLGELSPAQAAGLASQALRAFGISADEAGARRRPDAAGRERVPSSGLSAMKTYFVPLSSFRSAVPSFAATRVTVAMAR